MEKSSYLELFDKEAINRPYQDRDEALSEDGKELLALCSLLEKKRAGAISLEFAQRDWALLRLHRAHREQEPSPTQEKSLAQEQSPAHEICKRLGLNRFEETALFLALAAQEGVLSCEQLSRTVDRRGALAGLGAAKVLYRFRLELENASFEPARPEKLSLFLKSGWRENAAGGETPFVLRDSVWRQLHGSLLTEKQIFGCELPHRIHIPEQDRGRSVFLYKEELSRMETICSDEGEGLALFLLGERGIGKEFLACCLAERKNRPLLVMDGELLRSVSFPSAESVTGKEDWMKEIACFLLLSGGMLYLKNPSAPLLTAVRREIPGILLAGLDSEARQPEEEDVRRFGGRSVSLPIPAPSAGQKAILWREFLSRYPHEDSLDSEALGSKYVLNAGGIRQCLYSAWKWAKSGGRQEISEDDLSWAIRQSQDGQLGAYATLVPCVFGWEDLIVEDKVRTQLTYICGRLKYRSLVGNQWGFYEKMPYGRGLSALFYGPPGTGKTMAVQVIAKELGLELYRVDLSRMVSKYIGETEKNISALFEKARHMNVILFFDEADSFFSRRTDVRDANDKNANAEVAHLLQKLEEYEGITILASNLKEHIDDAFRRRISFMINFRLPSMETRRLLWRSMLPKQAPRTADLDLDFFAERFELSGSQIKEILLAAAYIAAEQGTPIGNGQIREALCINYEKYGKILTGDDFGYLN